MSYILDALTKSEQDRERQQPPRLTSAHRGPPRNPPWWRWITALLVLAVLNTALIWYWMFDAPDPSPVPAAEFGKTGDQPLRSAGSNENLATRRTKPESQSTQPPQPEPTPAVPVSTLPESIQKQIPDLTFTSHIYSSDPALRTVTINGRNFSEGDTVSNGLSLVEITKEGVVLRYLHYTFEMSVIRDWSFN